MTSSIHYTVNAPFPQNHLFYLTLTILHPQPYGQKLYLPSWIPGSYLIRDFARHIVDIRAECDGKPVLLRKQDKATWQAGEVAGVLTVYYRVYAYDLSVRGAYLDTSRGFFNGSTLFLAVAGQEDQPCRVTLARPPGKAYKNWQIATSLPVLGSKRHVFGDYAAENYDDLIDHPVEMGEFARYQFKAVDVTHEVVIVGRHQVDHQRLLQDMQKICTYQIGFFGAPAPFKRYVFLIMATGNAYGGLEHRSSSALICNRAYLPQREQSTMTAGYCQFLGLVSHEYFHSWNVKRIKPEAFAPYDLCRENYTRLLWAFEGITSYYDNLTLVRTGLISVEMYLSELSKVISTVIGQAGSTIQTLEEASFDAWIKYYRQDENSPNSLVSYYTKGAVVALLLDATIRQRSAGAFSLDDVMRAVWQRYGKNFATIGQGMPESAWESIAQQVTGLDLTDFFAQTLRQVTPLALQQTLAYLGVAYQQRPAASSQDKGGQWYDSPDAPRCTLGIEFTAEPIGVRIKHVFTASPAEIAGLAAGDILLAINGLRVEATTLDATVALLDKKQTVTFHLFRRDELMVLAGKMEGYVRPVCALRIKDNQQGSYALGWLGGSLGAKK